MSASFMSIPHFFHSPKRLWKTPVEKPVENVENFRLSTGILLLSDFLTGCGKASFPVFITPVSDRSGSVTSPPFRKILPAKNRGKCWNSVNKHCQSPPNHLDIPKFFVKIQQILFSYQLSSAGNTFVVGPLPNRPSEGFGLPRRQPSYTQEDRICRER